MKPVVLTIWAAGVASLLGGLWLYGTPAMRHFREEKALENARCFMATGDYRSASISARRALELNAANLPACEIMAELAERDGSSNLADWRRRIAELNPTTENKLLVAATLLRSENPSLPVISKLLEEIRLPGANLVSYHLVCAEFALRLGNTALAELHLAGAMRLEPTNELHELNLSVLRLQGTNAESLDRARINLEQLSTRTNIGYVALRSLIADALRREDLATAERLSNFLLADPRANHEDRLQHLSILHDLKSQDLRAALLQVQQEGRTNAITLYTACVWMIGHGLADEALAWITNCPAEIRAQHPATVAVADCLVAKKDWTGLEDLLLGQQWGEFDFLRFAFLARASQEQNQALGVEMRWRSAVKEARDRLLALEALLQLARDWGASRAREDLLREINQRFPREEWASRELDSLRQSVR